MNTINAFSSATTTARSFIAQNDAREAYINADGIKRLLMYLLNYIRFGTPLPGRSLTAGETNSLTEIRQVARQAVNACSGGETSLRHLTFRPCEYNGVRMVKITRARNAGDLSAIYCGLYKEQELRDAYRLLGVVLAQGRLDLPPAQQENVSPVSNNNTSNTSNTNTTNTNTTNTTNNTTSNTTSNTSNTSSALARRVNIQNASPPAKQFREITVKPDGYCMFRSILTLNTGNTDWASRKETHELYNWILENAGVVRHVIYETNRAFSEIFGNTVRPEICMALNPDKILSGAFSERGCVIYDARALYNSVAGDNEYHALTRSEQDAVSTWVNIFAQKTFSHFDASAKERPVTGGAEITMAKGTSRGYAVMVNGNHFNVRIPV